MLRLIAYARALQGLTLELLCRGSERREPAKLGAEEVYHVGGSRR